MKNFVLAPAVAALAMFFWGFLYYGISGVPYRTLQDSTSLAPAVASLAASGTYLVPDPRLNEGEPAPGPFTMVNHTAQPRSMGATMALGYFHGFACCALLSLLLWRVGAALDGFVCKFVFCTLTGLLVALFSQGCNVVWWHGSVSWALATAFYYVGCFVLAGAILAKLVRPKAA